jgi:hypothetical protein
LKKTARRWSSWLLLFITYCQSDEIMEYKMGVTHMGRWETLQNVNRNISREITSEI